MLCKQYHSQLCYKNNIQQHQAAGMSNVTTLSVNKSNGQAFL